MVRPQRAWDLTLTYSSVTLNLILARDEQHNPMLSVSSAPSLNDKFDTSEEVTYSSIPPNQGKTQPLTDVSKGAGKADWEPGYYAFG